MNINPIKAALVAARDRIRHYNKLQRTHSFTGKGTIVDNEVDAKILREIDAALEALKRRTE
jgi:hypothetical protein